MPDPLRVSLAQVDYTINDFEGNVARMEAVIAASRDTDLVVFSELSLCGYYPQDLLLEPDFIARQQVALERVLAVSRHCDAHLVVGLVTRHEGVGKPLRNSLALIRRGEVLLTYHKQLLPTYNIFDERRHFEPGGRHAAVAHIRGWPVGFLICEDGWNDDELDYAANPLEDLAQSGAQLVISINASPSNIGKRAQRHRIFGLASARYGFPIVYVNQVGGNDQLVFDGASFIVTPAGVVFESPRFVESCETVEFTAQGVRLPGGRPLPELAPALSDNEFYYRQIVLGLQDYCRKIGFRSVVIGSSGGIDSALTLALAADALGAANVTAVTMPSRFSSAGSVDDSVALCERLGVRLFEHPIGTLFDTYLSGFDQAFGVPASGLTSENLQARIRGAVLMAYSNHFGHLVLSTGNKSEISVGYATLYGDMCGGLNLIGDLYKTEVFGLARWYNEYAGAELIPRAILDKPPSAELAPDQKDTDSLPPYEVLDEILKLRIEGQYLRAEEFAAASHFVSELDRRDGGALHRRVRGLIARSEFKRKQAAPIIRVRGRAFGTGRQVPLAANQP